MRFLSFFKIIIIGLSGIIMGLSLAPFSLWYLAWIALIPLWIIIRKSDHFSFLPALIWGLSFYGFAIFWITGIHPMTWLGVPWLNSLLITILVWLLLSFWGAFLVTIWAVLLNFFTHLKFNNKASFLERLLNIILAVSLWCILEKIYSYTPLWWTSLSLTQSPNNLAILQLLKFSGTTTITALILAVNLLIAESLITLNELYINQKLNNIVSFLKNSYFLLIGLSLLILTHLGGFYIYNQPVSKPLNQQLKIGIIQGNIPNEIKFNPQGFRKAIEGYTKGYQNLAQQKVQVILTPETALPFTFNNIKNSSSFYEALLTEKIPVFLGAFGEDNNSLNNDVTNSLFSLSGDGQIISRYDKINLVPLGEYIPFSQFLSNIIDRLSPLDAQLIKGTKNQIFNTTFGKAIVSICYDSAFPQHFRRQALKGGEFIITASNNAHYSSNMPAQHHAQDVMRAIETNRWAARATNTGYSAIVDYAGRTIWRSQLNTYEIHAGTIYRRQTQTLYVKWGDWLIKILGLFTLCFFIYKNFLRSQI